LSRVVRCLKTALLEGSCSIFRKSVIERYKKFVVKHIVNTNKVPHNLLYTPPQNVIILSIFSSKNKERERERSFNTVDFHRFLLSQGALRVI
jgi:hypothetical protein